MCAVVTSLADFNVVYLGPNSPVEDMLKTIEHSKAQLLCLSISNCVEPKGAKDQLRQIRRTLNKKTNMIIGGEGASDAAPGIIRLNNFSDYLEWISQLNK
jgi:methanogenic corrinoid protein MtbC1